MTPPLRGSACLADRRVGLQDTEEYAEYGLGRVGLHGCLSTQVTIDESFVSGDQDATGAISHQQRLCIQLEIQAAR